LSLPAQRELAINMIEKIQADPHTTVIPFSADNFQKAFSLYRKRFDKS